MLNFLHLGPSSTSRSSARTGPSFFTSGLTHLGSTPPMLKSVTSGTALSPKSLTWIRLAMLVLNFAHASSSALLRGFCQVGPSPTPSGLGRSGPVFLLFVIEHVHLSSPSFARSSSCLRASSLALDSLHLGSFMFPRSLARIGLPVSSLGLPRLSFVFPLPVSENTHSGILLSIRSLSCLEAPAALSDLLHLGTSSLPRSSTRSSVPSPVFSLSRVNAFMLAPNFAISGPVLSPRSFSHSEPSVLALNSIHAGSIPPLRSFAWLGTLSSMPDLLHPNPPPLLRIST